MNYSTHKVTAVSYRYLLWTWLGVFFSNFARTANGKSTFISSKHENNNSLLGFWPERHMTQLSPTSYSALFTVFTSVNNTAHVKYDDPMLCQTFLSLISGETTMSFTSSDHAGSCVYPNVVLVTAPVWYYPTWTTQYKNKGILTSFSKSKRLTRSRYRKECSFHTNSSRVAQISNKCCRENF